MRLDLDHQSQRLVTGGAPLDEATAAVVLVHGRGATAPSILELAGEFDAEGVAYLAPQADRNTWYPNSFLAPVEENEPGRSSGLAAVGDAVEAAVAAGIPHERVGVMGFSQGACLASEFVARNPRRYGFAAALSGGLIGETLSGYEGDLAGTPYFMGCSNVDPHIPVERVDDTAEIFAELGADVDKRIYEGMGHGVNQDELAAVAALVQASTD
jgi:phospholipase/carboxylesterase